MKYYKRYVWWSELAFFVAINLLCIAGYARGARLLQSQISGNVTDNKTGETLPGVNIAVKGTTSGTSTDANGAYTLEVESLQDTLVFSFVGYQKKEVPINGNTVINVQLTPQVISGEELVVVGYGTQKSSDLSSSISSVSPEQLQKNSVLPNAALALEGTTAGLSVTPRFGQPGTAVNIRIRGSNTFGDNNPLVIIDGTPGSLNDVNPSDIANIQVLKDAAAAAIYGTRAANGVVIVTTKDGQSGKTHVDVKTSYGIQSAENFIDVTNAQEYAIIDNKLHESSGLPKYDILSDPSSLGEGTNWQQTVYNTAPIWNGYLGISGGDENSTYRISGSFDKQEGILENTGYRKALLHYNGQQNLGSFTFGESVSWTDNNQRHIPGGGDKDYTLQTILAQPIIPVYDSANEGGFGGAPSEIANQAFNPLGLVKLQQSDHHNNNLQASAYGQLNFLNYFTYKLNAGYTVGNIYDHYYTPSYYFSTVRQQRRANLTEDRSRHHHWVIENTLQYKQQFDQHNINILAGYTIEEDHSRGNHAYAEGFPNNNLRVLNATTAFNIDVGGSDFRWDLVSLLGRVLYNYGNRYYLTANIRRDGSSKFGQDNRYALFPSASLAWRISNESFFKPLESTINNLKIRGSYGVLGNQPNANYSYIPTIGYDPFYGYLFGAGGNYVTGAAQLSFANPAVKWETTKDLDIGIDLDMFDHISLKADYYLNKTEDLLLTVPIPPSTGSGAPLINTGKLQNQGVELSLTYNSPTYDSGFNYSITGNASTVRNKVLRLGYAGEVIYGAAPHRAATGAVTAAKVGYPIGAFFVKQADGLFQNKQEVDNWTNENGDLLQPQAEPGDVRYIDVNGDGTINNSDVAYSGSPFPKFSYGLNFSGNFKNFDFTLFLQGTYGNKMFDSNTWITSRTTLDYNFNTDLLNAWTPDNTDTDIPRLTFDDANHNSDPSTRFLYNASYLRFKTVQLGYTLPSPTLTRWGISNLRVFINGNNLWTITKYPGYDPSYTGDALLNRGLDQGLYPIARTITGGIEFKF